MIAKMKAVAAIHRIAPTTVPRVPKMISSVRGHREPSPKVMVNQTLFAPLSFALDSRLSAQGVRCNPAPIRGAGSSSRTWNTPPAVSALFPTARTGRLTDPLRTYGQSPTVLAIGRRCGAREISLFAHRAHRYRSCLGVSGTSGSNLLSSSKESGANRFRGASPDRDHTACCGAEPEVRIHLPPAASLVRT